MDREDTATNSEDAKFDKISTLVNPFFNDFNQFYVCMFG